MAPKKRLKILSTEKAKPVVSKKPIGLLLESFETAGYGDCAFHAAFGVWDDDKKMFICNDVAVRREQAANTVRACTVGDPVYLAVKEGIQDILIDGHPITSELKKAKIAYQKYVKHSTAIIAEARESFLTELYKYPQAIAYIDANIPEAKQSLELKDKFFECINGNESDILRAIIYSIEELELKYKEYCKQSTEGLDLNHILNDALLEEYSTLIAKKGNWLLPGELSIVAVSSDITIVLHGCGVPITFNPGQARINNIHFDGVNHYERMAEQGAHPSKILMFSREFNFLTETKPAATLALKQLPPKSATILTGTLEHASTGLRKTLHGNTYQLKLLMLFLKRGLDEKWSFQLATEMDLADKFDDVVFKHLLSTKTDECCYRYLQAKHRYDDSSKISLTDLLNESDEDFSLLKYFASYRKIKQKFKDGKLQDIILCTNIGFNFTDDNWLEDAVEEIKEADDILNVSGKKKALRYRFKNKFKGKKELYEILKSSDLKKLVDNVVGCIEHNKSYDFRSTLFKKYHLALAKEVFDIGKKKFKASFILKDKKLSTAAQEFRAILFEKIAKKYKIKLTTADYDALVQAKLTEISLNFSTGFGKVASEGDVLSDDLPGTASIKNEDIDEFLKLLVFAVDQPNEAELERILAKEIGEQFNLVDSEFIYSYFQKEMLNWMKAWTKDGKGTFLSHEAGIAFFEAARRKLDQIVLIGPTLEYKEALNKSKIEFKMASIQGTKIKEFLDAKNKQQILSHLASQSTELTSIKLYQVLSGIEELKQEGSYIFARVSSCLNLGRCLINAFRAGTSKLLIIECDINIDISVAKDLVKAIHDILLSATSKKVILVVKKGHMLPVLFSKYYKSILELKDAENGFVDLSLSYQSILMQKKISWQGVAKTLQELVPSAAIEQIINSEALLEIISSDDGIIDLPFSPHLIPTDSIYIPRRLQRKINIRNECLQKNISDIFVIIGETKPQITKRLSLETKNVLLFSELKLDKPEEYLDLIVILDEKLETRNKFHQIKQAFPQKNIHLLKTEGTNFRWQQSQGALSGLRSYLNDDYVEIDAIAIERRVIIISAEPGMGKSTTIDSLVSNEMKANQLVWAIKLDLKAINLADENFNNMADVIKFLTGILQLTIFAKNLLQYRIMEKTGGVVLFLDGFDEITTEHQTTMIQFMQILLRNSQVQKIVVATRQHMQMDLEDALGVFAHNLKPFGKEEQLEYLKCYWANTLDLLIDKEEEIARFKKYANKLKALFAKSTQDQDSTFMGIPLQVRMLAEAFQEDFKEYYTSDDEEPELPETLDLVDLYQRFKENKYNIWFQSKEKIDPYLGKKYKSLLVNALDKAHQHLAFSILFEREMLAFSVSKKTSLLTEMELKDTGIIQLHEGKISFVHRTFAEYFVANMLINLLKYSAEHKKHQQVKEFLLLHIFKARNQVIKHFIELMVIKADDVKLKQSWQEICDACLPEEDYGLTDDHETIHITEYIEDIDKTLVLTKTKFVELIKDFEILNGYDDIDRKMSFLNDFFDILLKEVNLSNLEQGLAKLAQFGLRTSLNKAKEKILERIGELIQHYISQILLNEDEKINIELITNFAKISASYGGSTQRQSTAIKVNESLDRYKNKLLIYKKLEALVAQKQIPVKDVSGEKILFWRIKNHTFIEKQLKALKLAYSKNFGWLNNTVRELFLQVDATNAIAVKDFFIEKREYTFLTKLFSKFPMLTLTDADIAIVYEDKGLMWLERDGVLIAEGTKTLTSKMVECFISPLKEEKINGYHTGYAHNIFKQLLLPLINSQTSTDIPKINKLAFIRMLMEFIAFSSKQRLTLSLNKRQLKLILKFIEDVFNSHILSIDILTINIKSFLVISSALNLKLIDMDQKLLVLDPVTDFSCELSLRHKSYVVTLLKIYKQDNDSFLDMCKKLIQEMLFPTKKDPLTPLFSRGSYQSEISTPLRIRAMSFDSFLKPNIAKSLITIK
jgi:hypothetical protein